MPNIDNKYRKVVEFLAGRLPPEWSVALGRGGAEVIFTAPDKRRGALPLRYREQLEPREVAALASERGASLVAGRFLSRSTRERLRDAGLSFVDLTGNLRLSLAVPGLFIEAQGASEDPDRKARPARTLKGPRAGRVVRALCDFRPPVGVRELAGRAGVSPGYVSRLLFLLEQEALVERLRADRSVSQSRSGPRVASISGSRNGPKPASVSRTGRVMNVDWERILRRWAADAPLGNRGDQQTFIEPRGLPALVEHLLSFKDKYAITGSLAASHLAAIASPRLAMIYVERMDTAAKKLALRPADSGANVVLIEPADSIVFERARTIDGLTLAVPVQAAADLLNSPGRGPAEAEVLIGWMREHPKEWQHG